MTEVQELLKLRAFVLRVVEEEGWKVAAKIPKPTPSETDEFRELLTEARKQAKPSEGFPAFYSRGTWRSRGTLCPAPTTYVSRVPESECDPEPRSATKQFNCYFCGGAGHTAAVCPSKSAEEQNNNNSWRYRSEQGGCRKNTRASSREILDGKDRTPTSSRLLVKELSASVSKECMEPHRKRGSKTLQTNGRTKGVVGGGVKSGTSDRVTTKAGGDKSLFENIVGNKLGNSQTVGKGYGQ
ncbi:7632_t:CDS:2, partial [Racocetra persica]